MGDWEKGKREEKRGKGLLLVEVLRRKMEARGDLESEGKVTKDEGRVASF